MISSAKELYLLLARYPKSTLSIESTKTVELPLPDVQVGCLVQYF